MPNREVLDEITRRIDFETFYREALPDLTRPNQAGEARARCPWHDDTRPSLSVNTRTGVFICRVPSCGARGDFFSFYMRRWEYPFAEAVHQIANRLNITTSIPRTRMAARVEIDEDAVLAAYRAPTRDNGERQPPRVIDEAVVTSAHRRLLDSPDLMMFLRTERGITRETVEWFQLGHDGDRYYIPIRDDQEQIVNIRRYKPHADSQEKMLSWRSGYGMARLFPLPQAFEHVRPIYLFEGELDAILACQHGLNAITTTGGAGAWRDEWNERFRGFDVNICYDVDDAGRAGAQRIARELIGVAHSVAVIDLPLATHGAEFTDFIVNDNNTIEDFLALVPPPISPEPDDPPPEPPRNFPLTDLGNGRRLNARHGRDLRYANKRWYVWDGCRYALDDTNEIERAAKDTVLNIVNEVVPEAERQKLRRHANASESASRLRSMIDMARSEPPIAVRPADFDTDPWALNCMNGTLDLRTTNLRLHSHRDLITKLSGAPFDTNSCCPQWVNFLRRIFANNTGLIDFVQRALGYSLTGDPTEQVLFFLYGLGANGKSTFLEVIRAVLGDYAVAADFSTLATHRSDGPRNDIARLRGARIVTASEFGAGRALDEAVVKQLTGGDTIAARRLYAESEEFRPSHTLMIAANHKPVIKGTDEAIWRRIMLIPFTVTIPPAERNPHLRDRLLEENAGILAWAVEGCLAWQRVGLQPPTEVQEATRAYRNEMDTLEPFLDTCCVIEPRSSARVSELYRAYKSWAEQAQENPISQTAFGLRLTEKGFLAEQRGGGVRHRVGLRLRGENELPVESHLARTTGEEEPPW